MGEDKKIDKKLDDNWSEAVKLRAGNRCEVCGGKYLISPHHIFGRTSRSTRWDLDNGICLCVNCHTESSKFSAHKTPDKFREYLDTRFGEKFMNDLERKSAEIYKPIEGEKGVMLEYFKNITECTKQKNN